MLPFHRALAEGRGRERASESALAVWVGMTAGRRHLAKARACESVELQQRLDAEEAAARGLTATGDGGAGGEWCLWYGFWDVLHIFWYVLARFVGWPPIKTKALLNV